MFQNTVRIQSPPLCMTSLKFSIFLVRWGSEASKKHKKYLVQSAFLWCQFYETQLHVHRTIALKNPADSERTAASMIICKNAAKRCIDIVQSANDVLTAPLCSYLLTVRYACQTTWIFSQTILIFPNSEIHFCLIHVSADGVLEEGRV